MVSFTRTWAVARIHQNGVTKESEDDGGMGRSVTLRLTAGQVHDSVEAEALLDGELGDGSTLLADL
ncbi:transposase [Haematospirillum sp. H1815]|nr:transposase [Haematospirillum jordaniae]NKD76591.1 transposase [Haematospirillum sp. H1815]NKD84400.1 transposase [Haematospirillum jordaniae]